MKTKVIILILVSLLCYSGMAYAENTLCDGDFIYTILEDGTAQIIQYTGLDTKVVFPDAVNGIPVTAIGGIGPWLIFISPVIPSDVQEVILPNGITRIGDNAFNNCINLKEINIPESIESIGQFAFNQCIQCSIDTNFPNTLQIIGINAFHGCKKLGKVIIPDCALEIGGGAFANCGSLSISLPNDVDLLTGNPFYENDSLSIQIRKTPLENALEIVNDCLYDNRVHQIICALPSVSNVRIRADTESIADWAFCKNKNIHTVTIPEGVKSIGKQAFMECGITEIVLPYSVTSINSYAFQECWKLKQAIISGHEIEMEERIFEGSALENITIMTTEIPIEMFRGCRKLTSVILSDEVTTIRRSAFDSCIQLQQVEIPSSVQLIEDYVFNNCENIQLIVEQDSYAHKYALQNDIPYGIKGEVSEQKTTSLDMTGTTAVVKTVNTKSSPLTLRQAPGNNEQKILSINKGETVTVLQDGDWPLIEYNGHQGYVNGQYLK